ncbi:MAG: cobyrinate a,c-diamide synthase [Oscillospiraceae bacterium]|nr:cobyrinate a,c-diamide synthase [Oscillospiraceae bacterium]
MNRFLLCAPGSGSGKTTVACGILLALRNRGLRVASFKCGPDYIDPMFHASVLGEPSRNLDPFFTEEETLRALFCRAAADADVSLIEGVMGYYDGIAATDRASTYEVAAETETPAVLVLPVRGMGLSAAAMAQGYCRFREKSRIAAILLNRAAPSIYGEMKEQIEAACGVPVCGYLPENPGLTLQSRHLGLLLPGEVTQLQDRLAALAAQVERTVDLDLLLRLASAAPPLRAALPTLPKGEKVRIAVARDEAFCFYYADNLQLLEDLGAELVSFSPLRDSALPEGCAGLLLGGGYPELHGEALAGNERMLDAVRSAIAAGMPTIAECGGFLYLHETMETADGKTFPLCGVLPGRCWDTGKLRRFGYVSLEGRGPSVLGENARLRGHEFHYFESSCPGGDFRAVKPVRGTVWDCIHSEKNLLCGFPHLYFYSNPACASSFLSACRSFSGEAAR